MLSSHLCSALCSFLFFFLLSRASRSVSCAVYRRDKRWHNLPSDRHAVNEHVDRSRFPRSSCMACRIAITVATAIDIACGPTRGGGGGCLPGEKNKTVRFCSRNSVTCTLKRKILRRVVSIISSADRKCWKRSKCCMLSSGRHRPSISYNRDER